MDWQAYLKIFTLLYVISIASSQRFLDPAIKAANGLRDRLGSAIDALRNGKPLNIGFLQIPGRNGNYRPNMEEKDYDNNQQSSESEEFNRDNLPYNRYENRHPHGGPPGHFPGRGPPGRYPDERPYGRYPDQDRYYGEGPPDRDRYPDDRYPDSRPPGHHHHHHHHHHHPPHDDFERPPPYNRPPNNGRPKPNFADQPNYPNRMTNGNATYDGLVLNKDYDETDTRNGKNILGYLNEFPVILLKSNEIR